MEFFRLFLRNYSVKSAYLLENSPIKAESLEISFTKKCNVMRVQNLGGSDVEVLGDNRRQSPRSRLGLKAGSQLWILRPNKSNPSDSNAHSALRLTRKR